jgi:F-type H+-transporting ATPase subunit b
MLIDWFTVGAQVVNFLILVWLLKRFLYKPILHAIDEREKRIAARNLRTPTREKAEAEKERDEFQKRNDEFDEQRAELLSKAKGEARAERQRLLEEARLAADALRAKQEDALKREQQSLNERNHPPNPGGSFCHRAQDADGPRRDKPGRTHERGVHAPPARAER